MYVNRNMPSYVLLNIDQSVFELEQFNRGLPLLHLPLLFIWERSSLSQSLLGDLRMSRFFFMPLLEGLQILLYLEVDGTKENVRPQRLPLIIFIFEWERTVVSSVRSCWFKLLLSSSRDSRLWIFSSLSSRVFFSADSILVSRILYLLKDEKVQGRYIKAISRGSQ